MQRRQRRWITNATFTGLLVGGATPANVNDVEIELYHVFPVDSDTTRTPNVLTRVNSPSDNNFAAADGLGGTLTFTTKVLNPSFHVANAVLPGGIHAFPNQFTGGQGPVTGGEVEFDVTFTTPFELGPDHVFSARRWTSAARVTSFGFRRPSRSFRTRFPRVSRTCSHAPATMAPARWRPIGRGSARISPIRGHSTPASR